MVCRERRHGGLLQSGRDPLSRCIHRRKSNPGRSKRCKDPGMAGTECEDVKTRPLWLELTAGRGEEGGGEVTELGRDLGG